MDVGSTMPNVKVEYASGSRVQEKLLLQRKIRDNIPFIFTLWRTGKTYIRPAL